MNQFHNWPAPSPTSPSPRPVRTPGVLALVFSCVWVLFGVSVFSSGATLQLEALWATCAAIALLRRRPWARTAVVVTFSVWSGQFAVGLVDSSTDPAWALFFLANVAVCSLVVFLTLWATATPT